MSAIWKRLEEKEEGFTLIELLVVVIIIGILAAIAIPVFLNQRESAWRSAAESDARNAAIAVETFYTQERDYPEGTLTWDEDTTLDDEAGDPVADITVSSDVTLEYENNDDGSYTIEAYHEQIDDGDEVVAEYISDEGGIQ